ncbi:MgtC/SapB family protein [Paenibacillus protaetiae]|uniref:MgtC/SapB family protein n=1 Tax=Paenibacillus protaetiae TaxID=2509456 RepID=A0A4P6EZ82_9BACL|nr:MgtC/SapB family protein [Paenibacillus protaetiae]QAY67119.1 MgtC/SapB family protein [Paenibacillus protaetiae]
MQYEYLLRLLIAGICGAVIGYERKSRKKEAGIRTHFIVSLGASLMMMISKYGFMDQLGWGGLSLDPSRVAAQVVSGVGFLGAGMIFMQKQTVRGLTTAAGIWATAGVGMAIGAGMYTVGISAAIVVLAGQAILHKPFRWLRTDKNEQLTIRLANDHGSIDAILNWLKAKDVAILSFHAEAGLQEHSELALELFVRLPAASDPGRLLDMLQEVPCVKSVEMQ